MKTSNKLWKIFLLPISGLLLLQSASSYAARCEYVIQNEWNSGFVAAIRITNDTNTAINGWSVNWSYPDGSSRTGGWNANFSGSNPYTASNVGWNGQINPGQTAEFGIQGNKGVQHAPAGKPTLTGAVCGGSSVSSVRSSSSSVSSSSLVKSSSVSIPKSSSLNNISSSARSNAALSSASRSLSASQSSTLRVSSVSSVNSSARSTSKLSSSIKSSTPNTPPVVDLKITTYGLTVHVETGGSTDADGDHLHHVIHFDDSKHFDYPDVWHTYKTPGFHTITATLFDDPNNPGVSKSQSFRLQSLTGNQAPVARVTGTRDDLSILAYGASSYDPDGTSLAYEWDFGDGPFADSAVASLRDCEPGEVIERDRQVVLTVSDGELKDTVQTHVGGPCGSTIAVIPYVQFNFLRPAQSKTVFFNGDYTRGDIGRFTWDFGDGTTGTGISVSHTYTSFGSYDVTLSVQGIDMLNYSTTQAVLVGSSSSQSRSSSMSSSFASVSSTSSPVSSLGTTSSAHSVGPNLPDVNLQVSVHGMTVYVDTRDSKDIDGDPLYHLISLGDGASVAYPRVWHTYKEPGTYIIEAKVSDTAIGGRGKTKTFSVTVEATTGNRAPIARLTGRRNQEWLEADGLSSFDWEGDFLSYVWDFGDGQFIGGSNASWDDCSSSSGSNASDYKTRLVTLTVDDGELQDTIQQTLGGYCNEVQDKVATAEFSYVVEGNKVSVDGSESRNEIGFHWNFGDGTTGTGLFASHTYASPGTYQISLSVTNIGSYSGSEYGDTITKTIVIESITSVSSSSSAHTSPSVATSSSSSRISSSISSRRSSSSFMSSSSSSRAFDSAASIPSSSVRSSSSQRSSDRNLYIAPRATTAPVIDGVVDSVWERASWAPINVFWLGTQSNPGAQDYSGRYKALWDENYLYILYDITDDRIYDGVRDPLDRYWEDDTVELFIDENKNGGQHGYNTSAWAYHISTYGDVVDSTTGGAKLLNDHIDSRLVSNGTQHYWELRIRIYGEDYADWKSNTPLQLYAGKLMGFSACYIDNDGSAQRESMMGSVDTQGHKNNQGYLDASVFGSLLLVES